MARHALQKETGAVGAKILYSDCTIHHGGIVLGVNGLIGFAHRQVLSEAAGNLNRLVVINNFSAVSGACLAVRKGVFDSLGGFDAQNLPNGLFDVDFCLRLGEKGYRIVWTPYAVMLKDDETVTERTIRRGNGPEVEFFKRRWHHLIENDPYYNPNLTRTAEDFSLRLS
jgi:GT2 family glycosyltransferase